MKTSNIILTVAGALFVGFAAVQIVDGLRQVRHQREILRPVLEQIDSSDIKVIKMVRDNANYECRRSNTKVNLIRFSDTSPSADALTIQGDTLIITSNDRVVIHYTTATHIIEWNGKVREVKD